jgi:hypothetical protein
VRGWITCATSAWCAASFTLPARCGGPLPLERPPLFPCAHQLLVIACFGRGVHSRARRERPGPDFLSTPFLRSGAHYAPDLTSGADGIPATFGLGPRARKSIPAPRRTGPTRRTSTYDLREVAGGRWGSNNLALARQILTTRRLGASGCLSAIFASVPAGALSVRLGHGSQNQFTQPSEEKLQLLSYSCSIAGEEHQPIVG